MYLLNVCSCCLKTKCHWEVTQKLTHTSNKKLKPKTETKYQTGYQSNMNKAIFRETKLKSWVYFVFLKWRFCVFLLGKRSNSVTLNLLHFIKERLMFIDVILSRTPEQGNICMWGYIKMEDCCGLNPRRVGTLENTLRGWVLTNTLICWKIFG